LVWLGLAGTAAVADDCAPGAVMASYRQGEAAFARKDFANAISHLRPLAEQGLGPAQLRLGQMLSGEAGRTDLVEAYRWTALAADVGAPGAQVALDKLTPHLSPQQIAAANIAPATWQPARLSACLAVDPRIKQPDGSMGYALDRLVNRVISAPSASGPAARRLDWLARNLEAIRTNSPRYLIYFKALYGIAFVGGAGSFVVTSQRDNLPMLTINESYADAISAERLGELVSAAVYAVHAGLIPPVVAAGIETYKGFTIRTTATDGGRRFLEFVKYAIDMTDQLPPELGQLARAMTDLRYEPQTPFDKRSGAISLGVYTHDAKTRQSYMVFTENFAMLGPAHIVISLVDGGIYLRRERTGTVVKPDPAHGDCEIEDYEIKTMEALRLDAVEINLQYKARSSRGCS
jgi:hypothetical protein